MSDVKRYQPDHPYMADELSMELRENGAWVSYEDYTALRARLAELEKERDRLAEINGNLSQSHNVLLVDGSNLQRRAERAEAALAQLEPRDGERWVTPDMIQYQYEWMEWLAGDQPLVPIDDLRAVQAALATARRDAYDRAHRAAVIAGEVSAGLSSSYVTDGICAAIRALANEAET